LRALERAEEQLVPHDRDADVLLGEAGPDLVVPVRVDPAERDDRDILDVAEAVAVVTHDQFFDRLAHVVPPFTPRPSPAA
jgi:hypothetical protein